MRLTVVTPTRNAAEYLRECLQSVAANRVPGVSIDHLIVDSGSSDATLEIARDFGATIINVAPVNVYHSVNAGYRVAMESDVIGFLGGDDNMKPGSASFLVDWFARRESSWLVGAAEWIDATGASLGVFRAPPRWISSKMHSSLGWNCLPLQSTFLTPEFLREVGDFDTSYQYSGDYSLFARALAVRTFDRTTRVLAEIRMHPGQLSRTPDSAREAENQRVLDEFAPDSRLQQWFHRYWLKVVLNAASPGWFYHKHVRVHSAGSTSR